MTTAPYDTLKSTYRKDSGRIGPYSKQFAKGATGDLFNGRTKEGKFIRKVEAELTAQLGGAPSFSQVLLIRRIARLALQAENFDNRMQNGNFTEYDGKVYGGLCNAIRLTLKELGIKAVPARTPSISEYMMKKTKI
jgi:hypothetical protein